jgi:hypothetical protein
MRGILNGAEVNPQDAMIEEQNDNVRRFAMAL